MWWLWCISLLAAFAAWIAAAHLRSPPGNIIALAGMEVGGTDGRGNLVISPARFRFSNVARKSFRFATPTTMWRFTVSTNSGKGMFVPAFEPEVLNFTPAGTNSYDFWLRDPRLLDCDWKVRVVRNMVYELPKLFHSFASSLPAPSEVWESDVLHPSLSNWKFEPTEQQISDHFRFPDHPTPTNQQPSFLTNSGSLFGERGLRYGPR